MATLNTLIRKASVLLRLSSQENPNKLHLLDGEIIYCKNNVCVHPPVTLRSEIDHHPGYLCIKAQNDEVLGSTLILSWIPNSTLKKNPRSLEKRTPGSSPCRSSLSSACPSPTPANSLPPPPRSGSQSPLIGTDKLLGNMGFFYSSKYADAERRSISSTMSDLGSPRDDLQSLDSWTTSDLGGDMTASLTSSQGPDALDEKMSPSTPQAQPSFPQEKDNAQSQTDSGIGPEEVTAALESMISGLNSIDEPSQRVNDCTESSCFRNHEFSDCKKKCQESCEKTNCPCDVNSADQNPNSSCDLGDCVSSQLAFVHCEPKTCKSTDCSDTSSQSVNCNPAAINATQCPTSQPCCQAFSTAENTISSEESDNHAKEVNPQRSIQQSCNNDNSSADSKSCQVNPLGNETRVFLNGVEHFTSSQEDLCCPSEKEWADDKAVNQKSLVSQRSKSSSTTPTTSNPDPDSCSSTPPNSVPHSPFNQLKFFYVEGTPESVAHAHNLTFPDANPGSCNSPNKAIARETSCGLFSVDLSQMRSLRLFFCDKEHTCGQLVVASRESQYKILHFHNGGLDKLATVFEEWSFLCKSNSKHENCPYRQFSVCRPEVSAAECHPEEGVYSLIDEVVWREFINEYGQIDDELQLRKSIFFGGLDHRLRREVWPFLLHHYGFQTTFEEREQIRNDRYIKYQAIRKERENMSQEEKEQFWRNVQCTVEKDVVRTDRSKPFFAGENNPNIEIMKNILLNYAVFNASIGYTQGMSDLLAPVLAEVQDECEAFWCFVGLMQRTIFFSSPRDTDMDANLSYLQELMRLMNPAYYAYLSKVKDGLELLFAHRWILLCFKREFPESEALRMWESCWAHYQTDYFHLFLCLAIVSIYGDDVIQQELRADEMLLHFSSLAMHMDGELVLTKARGLLHQFRLLPVIPCTLGKLCELCGPGMWDSGHVPIIECVGHEGEDVCLHVTKSIN